MNQNQTDPEETAFNSPIPLLIKFKQLIFGEKDPELIFKIIIFINLFIWLIFEIWHILSYYAINFRDVILEEKKINVEILILNRGTELGFDPSVFMERLMNYHLFSILCWLFIFVGIAFMWRTSKRFIYFIFVPLIAYLLGMFFFLGFDYYVNDTTFFDKIFYALFFINSIFYLIIFKNQNSETSTGFFKEEED
ncbi:MAG: hypothetical protein ACK5B9_11350 [Flavobacteriia bacterium]